MNLRRLACVHAFLAPALALHSAAAPAQYDGIVAAPFVTPFSFAGRVDDNRIAGQAQIGNRTLPLEFTK